MLLWDLLSWKLLVKEKESLKLLKKKGCISSLGYPYIFFIFMYFFMSPNLYIANEKGMACSSGLFSKSFLHLLLKF